MFVASFMTIILSSKAWDRQLAAVSDMRIYGISLNFAIRILLRQVRENREHYCGNGTNNGAKGDAKVTLATIQRLKGNGQFEREEGRMEARAEDRGLRYNYATSLSLDRIQTILTSQQKRILSSFTQ